MAALLPKTWSLVTNLISLLQSAAKTELPSLAQGLVFHWQPQIEVFCLICPYSWFWSWFLASGDVFYFVDAHKHRAPEGCCGVFLQTSSSVIFLSGAEVSSHSTVLGTAVKEKAVGFIQDQLWYYCPSIPDCTLQWLHKMCCPECGVPSEMARSYMCSQQLASLGLSIFRSN